MLKIMVLLSLAQTMAGLLDEQPYCALRYRRLCQGKGRHVACQFPAPGRGMFCQNYTQIKFTSDLRRFIVHYINRRRQRIAAGNERVRGGAHLPRPEIMMLVSWDRELAQLGQRLADQCQFVHDDCRATVRYPYAGQSVGEVRWRRSSDSDELSAQRAVRRVFDAWWGERRRVQPRQLTAPFRLAAKGTVWGHFSQLAVWTLRAVGCGAVRHGYEHTRMLLVCDFSHTNMLGQRTITPGDLAPCPMHTARRPRTAYPLLCAPVKKPVPPENKDDGESKGYDYDEDGDDEEDNEEEEEEVTSFKQTQPSIRTKPRERTADLKQSTSDVNEGRVQIERKGSTLIGYLVQGRKTMQFMDKYERELEMGNTEQVILKKYHQWETRRPDFARSRDDDDRGYDKFSRAHKKLLTLDDDRKPEFDAKYTTVPVLLTNQGPHSRPRWKQTRIRPQRPGANALLNKPPQKILPHSSIGSLVLDQDDSDQLFRDTGFNANWRKQPLQ